MPLVAKILKNNIFLKNSSASKAYYALSTLDYHTAILSYGSSFIDELPALYKYYDKAIPQLSKIKIDTLVKQLDSGHCSKEHNSDIKVFRRIFQKERAVKPSTNLK